MRGRLEARAGAVDAWVPPHVVDGESRGRATFALPADLPLGWHELRAREARPDGADGPGVVLRARTPLAVTPDRLEVPDLPTELGGRAWGLMAQLYSVRSEASWGIGDLADLAELASLAGGLGADFLLVNPLHAAEPVAPQEPSPYLPSTRRFVNPSYVRPEDVREAGYLPSSQRALVEWAQQGVRDANSDPGLLDRDESWAAKKAALEVLFAAPRTPARERAFAQFRAEQGRGLANFALWCAIAEHFEGRDRPAEADDITSPLVARLRIELRERAEFYTWLQWVADTQLAAAQRVARSAGMRVGVMHDLAVGVHPVGAETWASRRLFAPGMTVGAPPDMYNQQGQDWSQPPWRPDALARSGYAPLRDMVRTVLRHAGALRIDHVIGLFRLWWIPEGAQPDEGTYVRYDHEAMVGVLALEAHRARALLIGEDLGTVEPWVRDYLEDRGILGTSVLWFEKDDDGGPLPPEHYRELALATVTTHDLPPTAGYLDGDHVDLRASLGLLTEPVEVVRQAARAEREAMLSALRRRGLLADHPTEREVVEALHRYLVATPSRLLGVSLADAVGERRAQNQPGTHTEYPNWKVPLADAAEQVVRVEDLAASARLASLVAAINGELRTRADELG